MKISILSKITAVLVCSIMITGISVFFTAKYYMTIGFERDVNTNIEKMNKIVKSEINKLKDFYLDSTQLLADNPALVKAILDNDLTTLKQILVTGMKRTDAQFITLTDGKGNAIMRSHSDKRGDSILRQNVVKKALQGIASVNIERGTVIKFSLRTGIPVKHEGKIIGVLVAGEALDSNRFVDAMKEMTGLEMTVFEGDTRISTTLFTGGQRAVGTHLNNPDIVDRVIGRGETIERNTVLFGKAYKTIYSPMVDIDNKRIGMWFIGLDYSNVEKTIDSIAYSCIIAMLIITTVLILLGVIFSRALVKPLKKCVVFAAAVAGGSLKEELHITRSDEVGDLADALRKMVNALRKMIGEAETATSVAEEKTKQAEEATKIAEQAAAKAENAKREGMLDAALRLEDVVLGISSEVSQLSAQIEESDRVSAESSTRLSETTEAIHEMSLSVQDVARNAASASDMSSQTHQNAEEGQRILTEAMSSIDLVEKVSMELKNDMNTLYAHTRDISQIMNVISDIADQTNLLALNAAIEAARAGEAGRGFAVVATEVRKLAEKTMSSTNDVSRAISAIQGSAQQSVNRMEEALQNVEQATKLAKQSGEALSRIVGNVESTADQVKAIAAASEEQSASSAGIDDSIKKVNVMSHQTTEAMSEAAKAITGLAQQIETLRKLILDMKAS